MGDLKLKKISQTLVAIGYLAFKLNGLFAIMEHFY